MRLGRNKIWFCPNPQKEPIDGSRLNSLWLPPSTTFGTWLVEKAKRQRLSSESGASEILWCSCNHLRSRPRELPSLLQMNSCTWGLACDESTPVNGRYKNIDNAHYSLPSRSMFSFCHCRSTGPIPSGKAFVIPLLAIAAGFSKWEIGICDRRCRFKSPDSAWGYPRKTFASASALIGVEKGTWPLVNQSLSSQNILIGQTQSNVFS